jgi:hypothetical protein
VGPTLRTAAKESSGFCEIFNSLCTKSILQQHCAQVFAHFQGSQDKEIMSIICSKLLTPIHSMVLVQEVVVVVTLFVLSVQTCQRCF